MTDTPYSLQVHDEVTSTQDVALAAAANDSRVLVVAARQTQGRGRSQRRWETAPRALAASLAFAPSWPAARWPLLPLVAGLAAAVPLGDRVKLKWPNDLLVGNGKVGGILVETSGSIVVVGCGINLWWPDSPEGIAGLYAEDPGPDRLVEIATAWADRFLEAVAGGWEHWGREEYRARCETLGRLIVWEPAGEGRAVDIDEEGGLVVETDHGRLRLVAGEVRHLRVAP